MAVPTFLKSSLPYVLGAVGALALTGVFLYAPKPKNLPPLPKWLK